MPSARIVVPADHPAFAGHFPGQPLLPGVSLLAEVVEAILRESAPQDPRALTAMGVPVVKFLHPVRPGDELHIEWSPKGSRLGFEVRVLPAGVAQGADGVSEDVSAWVPAASGQLEWRS